MPRKLFLLWVAALTFMGGSAALAQDNGDGERVPIYTEPVYIAVDSDQPLAVYVRSVDDDTAAVAIVVKTTDGWQQLTPCDNVEVPCMNVAVKSEGIEEGDIFYLGSE